MRLLRLGLFCITTLVTGLAVPVALLSLPFAIADGRALASGTACEQRVEYDVTAAEELDHEWFPPRGRCSYEGYFRPSPSAPEWERRDSIVIAPVALLVAVAGGWTVRRRARAGVSARVRSSWTR